jgi:hypothetical protein
MSYADTTKSELVRQKAQVALAFQAEPQRIFFHYVRTRWKKQLLVTVFTALLAGAWMTQQPYVAIGIFGFWAGRLMRDYQWFWFLIGEWATTCELIDWRKAEVLARGVNSEMPS